MNNVRLAQIFDVDGQYKPAKASVYLKKVGRSFEQCWDVGIGDIAIDAPNFTNIDHGERNLIFYDNAEGLTGSGGMASDNFVFNYNVINSDRLPILEYPICTSEQRIYKIYFRIKSNSTEANLELFLDGESIGEVDYTGVNQDWFWTTSIDVLVSESRNHTLGIKLKKDQLILDKICISQDSKTFSGQGPDLNDSPYVTIHANLYEVDTNFKPSEILPIYDVKNTLTDITVEDWYNFNLGAFELSSNLNFDNPHYALVLTSSGESKNNYIVWELKENEEYSFNPSALRVNNV